MDLLSTERLMIRRFAEGDWKRLHDYLSLEEVVRFEPYEVFDEERSIAEAARRAAGPAFWAVCLKVGDRLIGNLYFSPENETYRTWELGYVFHPDFQGRGYAAEACRELVRYGFGEQNVRRGVAFCDPLNVKSWRLLERLGFRREGHMLQEAFFRRDADGNPLWHDAYAYAMLKSEWKE